MRGATNGKYGELYKFNNPKYYELTCYKIFLLLNLIIIGQFTIILHSSTDHSECAICHVMSLQGDVVNTT